MFGILISGLAILIVFSMMLSMGDFAILPVDLVMIGSKVVIALSCVTGLIGAGLLSAHGSLKSIYLMLAAALGMAVVRTIQPLLVSAVGSIGIPERFAADPSPLGAGLSIPILLPAIALLLASALGAYAVRVR